MLDAAQGALVLAALWLIVALFAPLIFPRRGTVAVWTLIAVGIPVLGWLTLHWGPMAGVSALAAGAVLISSPPLARRPRAPERSPAE
ncbi:DUF2484 family protein [Paracoccus tegillarcae]|uniref:DUF2484 family protein n=1 Tax=Paracoccus tegillarcae TaxID=1529068 RepID=UPI0013002007|nr:DUF2484 family protein [Paracoccus tegillarcae]